MALPLPKVTNSLFERLGQNGTYQGRKVLFLLSEPDEILGIGFAKAQVSTVILKIQKCDAPDITVGDEIVADEVIYQVMAEPRKDIHNLIWTIECGLN